jgi:hypothetical protein
MVSVQVIIASSCSSSAPTAFRHYRITVPRSSLDFLCNPSQQPANDKITSLFVLVDETEDREYVDMASPREEQCGKIS